MTYLVKILVNSRKAEKMEARFEDLITGYLKNKVGISEHFLSDALCEHLKDNLLLLNDHNLLKSAGIGNDGLFIHNDLIRRDSIYWLDKKHNNEHENEFFEKIDAFVSYLNQTCYTNIKSYEFHYSLYEAGDFYRKHLDQFKDDSHRQFSLISYLNSNWKTNDGGELLIYQNNDNQTIAPAQGKAVFFKSNELEHEVLVTNERRMSISGWLKRG
jgi:SM-20-related protein